MPAPAIRYQISDEKAVRTIRALSREYRLTESYVSQALIKASLARKTFEKYLETPECLEEIITLTGSGRGGKTPFLFAKNQYLFRDIVTLVDMHDLLDVNSITCDIRFLHGLLRTYPFSYKIFKECLRYLVSHKMVLARSYKIDEVLPVSAGNTETTYTISNQGLELVNQVRQEKYLTSHARPKHAMQI